MSTERLIREYVRRILREDQGGDHSGYTAGDIMASGAAMNPYGMHYGSGNDLYNTFIKPFVDVAQTTAGKTKEMSARTQTLLRTAFETVATTLIPVLQDDYKKIFEKEKEKIDSIRSEYGDVYRSNWDALLNNDIAVCAFFYSPAAFFTVAAARKSPEILLDMISILTGGTLDAWTDRVKSKVKGHDGHREKTRHRGKETYGSFDRPKKGDKTHTGSPGSMGYGVEYYEGLVREDAEAQDEPDAVVKALTSGKLKARLEKSSTVQKLEKAGKSIVRGTLASVFKQAQGVMSARSLQDLQQKTGAHLKGMEKLEQVPQQERQAAEQTLLSSTKKSMREFYAKQLEGQLETAIKSGVPQDSAYVRDYKRTIAAIKAL